ncbi:CynX/NimT family MFS transporter [Jeotgalicoccus halotolerans]|uniref:CP family cyanate transporter-like MFS transporter n=1 Tax=Jeotgalicoccus halotolerans TaxID=157227 RepID=A0A3E0AUB3_9STAP|nr:MFS transporter [Jeotgalicoccus halotolerans]REG23367.1 CP family cyanate transporter-like MFS transporter [Jeotgalicoccus halotolerans]
MGNERTAGSFDINTKKSWLLIIGVILVSTNLRGPFTSVGALIPFIRNDLDISNALAGSITTLPLLAFALISPFAPKIANRIGMEWTITLSLILLIIGIVIRSFGEIVFLFTGTFFIGLAIAIGNVLIPGIIKMNFPLKIGLMTGMYAIFMNLFGALGSGISVPLASIGNFGWQGALGVWSILAVISLLIWLPQLTSQRNQQASVDTEKKSSLWRSPLAWKITIFMGIQSLIFYTLITWLPDILYANGLNSSTAGWMLFLMQFSIIPFTFIIPVIAEKMKSQVVLSVTTGFLFIIGLTGLLQGNLTLTPIYVILLGIAGGSAFSLSMMFFTLRTRNGKEAAELSGMAQSFGYLLAAVGPVLVGALQDLTNGWTIPLSLLILISVIFLIVGMSSGKERQVTG